MFFCQRRSVFFNVCWRWFLAHWTSHDSNCLHRHEFAASICTVVVCSSVPHSLESTGSCGRRPVTSLEAKTHSLTLTHSLLVTCTSTLLVILYGTTSRRPCTNAAPTLHQSAIGVGFQPKKLSFWWRLFSWPNPQSSAQHTIIRAAIFADITSTCVSLCDQHFCQRFVMIYTFL